MALLLIQGLMRKSRKRGILQRNLESRKPECDSFWSPLSFVFELETNSIPILVVGMLVFVCMVELDNFIHIYYRPNTMLHPTVHNTASRTLQVL